MIASDAHSGSRFSRVLWIAALLLILALFMITRWWLLGEPLIGVDEAIYMVVADVMARGGTLYVDVWDHKPPGIYLIYQGLLAIYRSPFILHLAAMLLTLACVAFLVWYGRRFDGPWPAWGAGWLLVVFTAPFWASSPNAEIFLVALQLAALALLISDAADHSLAGGRAFAAGVLFGVAIMIKYVVAIPAVLVCLYLWRRRSGTRRLDRTGVLLLGAGLALPPVAGVLYCLAAGNLAAFFSSNFTYNQGYVTHDAVRLFWEYGRFFLRDYLLEQWPLLLLAAAGGGWWLIRGRRQASPDRRRGVHLMAVWLAGSVLAALAPLKFLDHYFLLAIPGFCFFGGLWFLSPGVACGRWRWGVLWLVFLGLTLPPAVTAVRHSLEHGRRFTPPFAESPYVAAETGQYLRRHTRPEDTIYVWRSFYIDIYFYAQRDPASRYFFWPHLLRAPRPPRAEEEFRADFSRRPPAYIVVGDSDIYPDVTFSPLENYLQNRCEFHGTVAGLRVYRRVR